MSNTNNTDQSSYGWGTIIIHWSMALIIIGMYPLGLYIDTLDYYDTAYRTVPHWHKSIGIILLALLLFRLVWKLITVSPPPLPHSRILEVLTKLVHLALYVLMFIALISGYMISTADGRAIDLFNWFSIPALPAVIENQEDVAGAIHYWSTTILISLAALHTLAAFKHHFINKDQTLTRMLRMPQESNG
jgi:cytochrome b561